MTDKSMASFAVVRFNGRTYQSGGVVAVIKGIKLAQRTLDEFDWGQSDDNRRAGWRYFLTSAVHGVDRQPTLGTVGWTLRPMRRVLHQEHKETESVLLPELCTCGNVDIVGS
jgi:hypothetical protein